MKIGYVYVSTQEQNTIRQEVLMKDLDVDEAYIDRMSGKSADRPELRKAHQQEALKKTCPSKGNRRNRQVIRHDLVRTECPGGITPPGHSPPINHRYHTANATGTALSTASSSRAK